LHGKRVAVELIVRVLACLAEGLGIRATARVFEVDPNTVLQWLVEAADQLEAFSRYFLCDVHVHQVQLDELYAVLRAVQNGELSETEAIKRLERSPCWVWTAMDPESKLLLVIDVGTRTLAMAQCVVHQVVEVLAPGCVPLFLTDGYKGYFTAILSHFGMWIQLERKQGQGPAPKPRWLPLPGLLYTQVIKTVRRRRLGRVSHRVGSKHGQNISYLDAEIIGSYFEEMFQTSRRLVWPLWSVSPRHLGKFLAQNKIRLFPHWRNACPGQVSGVWHTGSRQCGLGQARLADQYCVCRAPEPRHSPACRGGEAAGPHPMPG
jgi:transposase-like protein